jgi:hypothetical protein
MCHLNFEAINIVPEAEHCVNRVCPANTVNMNVRFRQLTFKIYIWKNYSTKIKYSKLNYTNQFWHI